MCMLMSVSYWWCPNCTKYICFIVKRKPGVSREFIYNVSPSTIIHVNKWYWGNSYIYMSLKPFSGYNWYKFHNKAQKNFQYIYIAQLSIIRRIQTVLNLHKHLCVLLWNVYKVYPEKTYLLCFTSHNHLPQVHTYELQRLKKRGSISLLWVIGKNGKM